MPLLICVLLTSLLIPWELLKKRMTVKGCSDNGRKNYNRCDRGSNYCTACQ